MTTSSTPRVAVVGSGLAGLTTAYLLRLRGVTVYLIEKSEKIGFHSSSIDIDVDSRWTVDVPMRSFQGGYYPHLIALYRHLGIPLVPTHFTFSFSHFVPNLDFKPYFIHSGASGNSVPSFPTARSTILSVLTWLAYAGAYILLLALAALSYHSLLPCLFGGAFSEMVDQISAFLYHPIPYLPIYTPLGLVWRSFIAQVVIPLFSSVGTMPDSDVYSTPAKAILDYIHLTVGTDHYALSPGHSARTVAERLVEPVKKQGEGYLRLGCTITYMRYEEGRVVLSFDGEEGEVKVDRVVLATPASVARSFLGMMEDSLAEAELTDERLRVGIMKKALAQVRYKETIVVTHRDKSVLPPSPDVRDINLVLPPSCSTSTSRSKSSTEKASDGQTPHFDPEEGYTMATHVIRPPQSRRGSCEGMKAKVNAREAVYQTTNPVMPIRQESVLGIARLERALPLQSPRRTIAALYPGPGLIYLAGAYAHPGIPLLEGCVGSAKRAVDSISRDFDISPPGRTPERRREVDWSQGRGGVIGRMWRWRRRDVDIDVDVDT